MKDNENQTDAGKIIGGALYYIGQELLNGNSNISFDERKAMIEAQQILIRAIRIINAENDLSDFLKR